MFARRSNWANVLRLAAAIQAAMPAATTAAAAPIRGPSQAVSSIDRRTSTATVERQQLAENIVVGDVRRPTVRGSYSRVKSLVRIGEPLRPGVVEARQRALLERLRRVFVAGHWPLRVAGHRLVDPVDPTRAD